MAIRHRLFVKYAALIVALVGGALVASGAISLYFSYGESKQALFALQREKADAAAYRIEQYVRGIEHELGWTALPRVQEGSSASEQRRIEFLKLLRQAPQITEAVWIDRDGREQVRVSRLAMDALSASTDLKNDPRVVGSKGGRTYFGPVTFRKDTEPYMAIARSAGGQDGGTTAVEVNLKFVWDVVSQLRIGKAGIAYVVDAQSHLVAHPDISLVLQKLDWAQQPQVIAARAAPSEAGPGSGAPGEEGSRQLEARTRDGKEVLVAYAPIPSLDWRVFVEVPREEVLVPVLASMYRTGAVLLVGLILSILASVFMARRMVRPIRALQEGAAQIGSGNLQQEIVVKTGDELEALANQFNTMAVDLKESYGGLERKVEERTSELTETLEQQTATSDILRVIGSSPTDDQPVFDAIVQSAGRLFAPHSVMLALAEGDVMHLRAHTSGLAPALASMFPRPVEPEGIMMHVMREKRVVYLADSQSPGPDWPSPAISGIARAGNYRSITLMPLLRQGESIGLLTMTHPEPDRSLSEKQLALLQTFADQAVIAIENVRLFNETKEALERQTATAEILRVISGSPTDVQPVFDAIVRSAAQLFAPHAAGMVLIDGDLVHLRAQDGGLAPALANHFPRRFDGESLIGKAMRERRTIYEADAQAEGHPSFLKDIAIAGNYRSLTIVPLVRQGEVIGSLSITHPEPNQQFNEKQLALLQTFADQAVIAIENVRLFNETKEALERQTATAEILRVISNSPTDEQPVFDAIVASSIRLFDGHRVGLLLVEGGQLHMRARGSLGPIDEAALNSLYPMPLNRDSFVGQAILDRTMLQIADVEAPGVHPAAAVHARKLGYRSTSIVPLLREGVAIGAITVPRAEPGEMTDKQLALLSTFADQAVIAIENVRLFREIEDKNRQLEIASKHKSEFLANMSHELRTPLNAIIGFSEVLGERMFGDLNEKQAEYADDIHTSGKHLLSLINDILDLAKVEAGRMELNVSDYNLPAAIDNALTLVRERATRHGVSLAAEIDAAVGDLRGDERKVKQIMLNLLSNAVKFTPEGGKITVLASHVDGFAQIAVRDTGVGIAPEDQAAVFEEFKQVGTDVTKKGEGTGLGLALTMRFVELHGGRLWLESTIGAGSTFTFTLPLELPAAVQAEQTA